MSFGYGRRRASIGDTAAGGEATLGAIFSAAIDQMLYVDNSFASQDAEEEAFDRRIEEVFSATGVKLDNPMRALRTGRFPSAEAIGRYGRRHEWFAGEVEKLTQKIPDQGVVDRLTRSTEGEAIRIARESDDRLALLMESRAGIGKHAASFAGAALGSLRDPIALASLALGGGPGAGRTVAQRILSTAMREAAVNAASEAAIQPFVQAWRKRAGLEHGLESAAANIAFAGALGGLLGAGGRSIAEAVSRSGRSAPVAELPAAAGLPAATRGALDHAETLGHLETLRPAAAAPEIHDLATAAAHRADIDAATPVFDPDPVQIGRVSAELAPAGDVASQPRAQSLVEFLTARGGVVDHAGELKAIGAERLARRRKGEDRRASLDGAREAAEEAGYIGRAGETQVTTIADLLDAIDTELRGSRVYARDADVAQLRDAEAERARIEAVVAEVARHAGPAVDDRLLRQAAEISLRDGIDPFHALESVLIRADDAPAAERPGRTGEPLPGWSDEELDAAAAARGDPPRPDGLDEPGSIEDHLQIDDADALLPQVRGADEFDGDWRAAVEWMQAREGGEVAGFLKHRETGPIDVVWGHYDPVTGEGAGLAKIVGKHSEVVARLPEIVAALPVKSRSANRVVLESADHVASVRLDFDGKSKTWLLTAFAKDRRPPETTHRVGGKEDGPSSSSPPAGTNIAISAQMDKEAAELMALREEASADELIPDAEGRLVPLAQALAEIKRGEDAAFIIENCRL